MDVIWGHLSEDKASCGIKRFPKLSSIALLVLTPSHSNADEERVFSLIKKSKTEFTGSLGLNRTLSSIITMKMNLDGESHQFRPSASLIKKSKSSTGEHNRLHKKTTTSSWGTDSHHQPVASPEENAPATPPNCNRTEPPSSMDKTDPVLQRQNATNCKLPTSKFKAKASAANDCKPGIPVAADNSPSPYKDIDPAKQKSKLFGKRKSLGSVFRAKQAKKEEKSRGSQGKKAKIDDRQEEKTSVSSKNLKQPTILNFQRKVAQYKAVQIHKELDEVFLQFSRDNTLNNTETCSV